MKKPKLPKKFTKAQRHEMYIWAYNRLKNGHGQYACCRFREYINERYKSRMFITGRITRRFAPEFMKFKPKYKDINEIWFDDSRDRFKALKHCINLTKPK